MKPGPNSTRWLERSVAFLCCVLAGVVLMSTAGRAQMGASNEICVECSGPEKVYVCQIEKGEKIASFRAGLQALQYLCVSDLARLGGHARCKARRSAENCLGTIHTVSIAEAQRALVGGNADPPNVDRDRALPREDAASAGAAGKETQSGSAPRPPSQDKEPPRTVKELAERTMGQSQDQAKAAGDAVAGGFAKSWKCVTTLFQKCF